MTHKHVYDEYGLCFECDKPKPKSNAENQKADRERKKASGLVRVCFWVTPSEKAHLKQHLTKIRRK